MLWNNSLALVYQNECNTETAVLNSFCCVEQEVANVTVPKSSALLAVKSPKNKHQRMVDCHIICACLWSGVRIFSLNLLLAWQVDGKSAVLNEDVALKGISHFQMQMWPTVSLATITHVKADFDFGEDVKPSAPDLLTKDWPSTLSKKSDFWEDVNKDGFLLQESLSNRVCAG